MTKSYTSKPTQYRSRSDPRGPIKDDSDPVFQGDPTSLRYIPVDTRGIPYDADPSKFYEYSALQQEEKAVGIESLVYSVFGPDFIGSLAMAIDPFAKFKMSTVHISPWNRTRYKLIQSSRPTTYTRKYHSDTFANHVSGLNEDETIYHLYTDTVTHGNGTSNPQMVGKSRDTTARTRQKGCDFGEAEFFIPSLSGGVSVAYRAFDQLGTLLIGSARQVSGKYEDVSVISPFGMAFWSSSIVATLQANVGTRAAATLQQNVLGMVHRALPLTPRFTGFREAAELRDLPRTLRDSYKSFLRAVGLSKSLGASVKTLRLSEFKTTIRRLAHEGKSAGNTYLNYLFGWMPLIRDVQKLLELPEVVSKRVNRLIETSGRPTMWSSTREFIEPYTSPPSPTWYGLPDFSNTPESPTLGVCRNFLRCTVSTTVRFPDVRPPILRRDLLDELWGTDPTLSDLYDLIPWSWLIDWFGDFGDYVHLMDRINDDRLLINYGFLSLKQKGKISASRKLSVTRTYSRTTGPPQTTITSNPKTALVETAELNWSYYVRRDISTLYDAKVSSDFGSLDPDQAAILAALYQKFGK